MDRSGTTFGNYEILRPLGAGGMGEVLLARQAGIPGLERLVVIKKVLPHLAQDQDFISRFLDETRVASLLTHGNIVQVYEVGQAEGQYFMAMEFVDGLDLKEALALLRPSGRRMPEHLALYVLTEVAKALAYAHERRAPSGGALDIVHRDVSPANLLLAFDGQVKLTDFGVAKAAARLSVSLPGTLHGKVYYMSPEQVTGGECDARSDVFSLGVVAYEMLSGQRPFEGDSEVAVIDAVRRCAPESLRKVAPWIAPSLEAIVSRALAREPAARHPSMHDLQAALTTYMLEAHTIVSAKAMAEFLDGLRREKGLASPATPPSRASLDDVAASLLEGARASGPSPRTRTVLAAPPAAAAGTPPASSRYRGLVAGAVVLLMMGLGAGLWAVGLDDADGLPVPVEAALEADDAPDVPAPADATAVPADPGTAAAPLPDLPAAPAPDPGPAPAEPPLAAPGHTHARIRTVPKGVEVFQGDRRLGTTPLDVALPRTGTVHLELRLDGYATKTLALGPDAAATQSVTLDRLAVGRTKFRFFPADARVSIDGRPVKAAGNVVSQDLSEGDHVVAIEVGERRKEVRFKVNALETTELGTIELGAGPGPAAP